MKTAAIFVLLFAIISCKQGHPQEKSLLRVYKNENVRIFGDWAMCATSSATGMTTFNSCPIISFKNNGTGAVAKSLPAEEFFTWALKVDTLTIVYPNKRGSQTFGNGQYQVKFMNEGRQTFLDIRMLDSGLYYHLSR